MSQLWYYTHGSGNLGPVTEQQMIALINDGSVTSNTMVWCKGFTNWFTLQETTLSRYLPIQQTTFSKKIMDTTANPVSVDNTLVWILAFAPLIGGIIDVMLGIWISTLVINIALSYMDDNNLKKQGVDTEKFGSAWLVPVYLYNRAQYFNHGMSYFSIWIITFVFSFFLIG